MARTSPRRSAAAEPGLDWLWAVLIAAAGLWIYAPGLHGDWLWDDNRHITENKLIQDPHGFWRVLVSPDGQGDYDPLTSAVRWMQWQLWGRVTFGYHVTNLALHLAGAFLVWRLFHRLAVPAAALGALLFTVHPVMVETVVWITELKNTLSLPLLLLAMLAWLKFDEKRRARDYAAALSLFLAALLAKSAVLMLPVVLLGYAWWKRGALARRDLVPALPFLALALAAALATALAHPPAPPTSPHAGGLASALASTGWTLLFMLGKCLVPVGLLPEYPGRVVSSPALFGLVPWLLAGAGGWAIWHGRATWWGRPLLAGVGFFLVNLAPVLGFMLKHAARMVWSLDHLLYLPIIGIIGVASAAAGGLRARLSESTRPLGLALVALAAGALAFESHWYVTAFGDEETLWTFTLDRAPHFPDVEENMGRLLLEEGRAPEAKPWFEDEIRIEPGRGTGQYDMAQTLAALGRYAEAIPYYQRSLQLEPDTSQAEDNFGAALARTGQMDAAKFHFSEAIRLDATNPTPYLNLGSAQAQSGDYAHAAENFTTAARLAPGAAMPHDQLGEVLLKLNRTDEARRQFEQAQALDPGDALSHGELEKMKTTR